MAFTNRDVEEIVIEAIGRFASGEHNEVSERKVLEWLRRNSTAVEDVKTYYGCQSSALIAAEHDIRRKGYNIMYPDRLWSEHVSHGQSVKYDFPLYNIKKEKESILWVHIQLYRMGNGSYELNHYIS
jgi:hypothetical protein